MKKLLAMIFFVSTLGAPLGAMELYEIDVEPEKIQEMVHAMDYSIDTYVQQMRELITVKITPELRHGLVDSMDELVKKLGIALRSTQDFAKRQKGILDWEMALPKK